MLRQNELFRRLGLRLVRRDLLLEVTRDPAMLLLLSGVENSDKDARTRTTAAR